MILAGGLSSRLGGGDKCLIELCGRPLLAHVISRLAPQVDPVGLNANGDPARFAGYGLPVWPDPVAGYPGPLAGFLAALDFARDTGCTFAATAAADTPFLPENLVSRLATASEAAGMVPAVAASQGRAHPVFALLPVSAHTALRDALAGGARKVMDWLQAQGAVTVDFAVGDHDPFFNINTPDDLEIARSLLKARTP